MKTSIFRRGISGLLAVLMTFTALMGIGTRRPLLPRLPEKPLSPIP